LQRYIDSVESCLARTLKASQTQINAEIIFEKKKFSQVSQIFTIFCFWENLEKCSSKNNSRNNVIQDTHNLKVFTVQTQATQKDEK